MTKFDHPILVHLAAVQEERDRRAKSPQLMTGVQAIKQYQHRRFADTYADLLRSDRYAPAARFFLDELYGPGDFSKRDAQFARVIPALVRIFPADIVRTVEALTSLHALSETLDSEMGAQTDGQVNSASDYAWAWQCTGRAENRERQIVLMLSVGASLDALTRKPLLRTSLLMMRTPARAAGLAELQQLLERGFETFRSMGGAQEFLEIIGQRERAVCSRLFSGVALHHRSDVNTDQQ